jgi:thiol-disulfide isomerase/thioredoxin/outer membrane murein-binding lipoprotein Lpp
VDASDHHPSETPEDPSDETVAPSGGDRRPPWANAMFVLLALVLAGQVALGWLVWTRSDELAGDVADANAQTQRLALDVAGLATDVAGLEAASSAPSSGNPAAATGLPAYPASGPDPAVGLTIPDITGTDHYTGDEIRLGVGDQATITMVWAHWCPYCQQELPMLQDVVTSGALDEFDGVRIQTVSTFIDDSRPNPLGPYLDELALDVPVLVDDDGSVAAQLGMAAVPAWIVTSPDGEVLGRFSGAIGEESFLAVVADVQALVDEG